MWLFFPKCVIEVFFADIFILRKFKLEYASRHQVHSLIKQSLFFIHNFMALQQNSMFHSSFWFKTSLFGF